MGVEEQDWKEEAMSEREREVFGNVNQHFPRLCICVGARHFLQSCWLVLIEHLHLSGSGCVPSPHSLLYALTCIFLKEGSGAQWGIAQRLTDSKGEKLELQSRFVSSPNSNLSKTLAT